MSRRKATVTKTIYIAGPMRGLPEFNFPAFDTAEALLTEHGYQPINPAQHDRDGGFDAKGMTGHEDLTARQDFDIREALKWDLEQVAHVDAVAVLPGWENSSGARAEVALAHAIGTPVYPLLALASDLGPTENDRILPTTKPSHNGEVRTVSATGGQKGTKPERYDLIPVEALAHVARLYGAGAVKYSAHNWRKGYEWSKSYAAMQRHATQFWAGEDTDAEMGTPHLASVIFHAMALLVFMEEHRGFDDRFTTTKRNAPFVFPVEPHSVISALGHPCHDTDEHGRTKFIRVGSDRWMCDCSTWPETTIRQDLTDHRNEAA